MSGLFNSTHTSRPAWRGVALAVTCACVMMQPAWSQTAQEGKNLSALAPENLKKARVKAPVDFTGTYDFKPGSNRSTGMHQFQPLPTLTAKATAARDKRAEYQKKGLEYRDDAGACWPLGMPRMMTRFWPIQIVQLPTMVLLITMFDNSVRWIYTDGRGHPPEDELVFTYNGHSIGRWEGKTLVVDTVGMTDDHKWMQEGIPSSTQLHVVERYTMNPDGKSFEVEFRMTDPVHWEGEWVSKKLYERNDYADIEEHVCILEQVNKLPSFKANIRE